METTATEPEILTANTYFWTPNRAAHCRRRAEERQQSTVENYFKALGMDTRRAGDAVIGEIGEICARFFYRETCGNVYKSLEVTRGGKRSNITTLRKLAK